MKHICILTRARRKLTVPLKTKQLFVSDDGVPFSSSLGWTLGPRTARYAIVIDHGKVVYAEKEPTRGLDVSSAETVLSKL